MLLSSMPFLLADSEIPGSLIGLIVLVIFGLISKGLEYLKKKYMPDEKPVQDDDEDWDPETTSNEKQIRDIIRSLERDQGMAQGSMQQQHYPEPPPVPTKLTKRQPDVVYQAPAPPSESRPTIMQQAAATVDHIFDSSVRPANSLDNLSDAERAALERLKQGALFSPTKVAVVQHSPTMVNMGNVSAGALRNGLNNQEILRAAILYHEILGKPVALRDAS